MTKYEIEAKTVEYLKTVFDPEIPVNVWDLGMIYKIDVHDAAEATEDKPFDIDIDMTFTAPNCPAADSGSCRPHSACKTATCQRAAAIISRCS